MKILPEVHRLDASILTVTPQVPERAVLLRKEANLEFPILFDEGNAVAEQWGLKFSLPQDLRELYTSWGIDLEVENGDDSWTLAMPAAFVIDTEGVVQFRYVNPDYRFRPEPSEAYLPVLESL